MQSELTEVKSSQHLDPDYGPAAINDSGADDRSALAVTRMQSGSSGRDHNVVIAAEEIAALRMELADTKQQMTTNSYTSPPPPTVSLTRVNAPQALDHNISVSYIGR